VQATRPDRRPRPREGQPAPRAEAAAALRTIDSATLLGTRQAVQICHHGAVYTLRETRQGKLILNK
jgi:hemin uptake protein HemP